MESLVSYSAGSRGRRRGTSVANRSSMSSGANPSLVRSQRRVSLTGQLGPPTTRELWRTASEEDRLFFTQCVRQVQCQLKESVSSMNFLRELASHYTRVTPVINGLPFCVSLSYATFLFHMQMAHVCMEDVERYAQLIATTVDLIPEATRSEHAFVSRVICGDIFGLSSFSFEGPAHYVVLVPDLQYRAFSFLAVSLVDHGVVPNSVVGQWHRKLRELCGAVSPLVSNRALSLLLKTTDEVDQGEQVDVLKSVIKGELHKMHVEHIVACYERLKRAVSCIRTGPEYGRSLAIRLTSVFLNFRSPVRREFVEQFLYPSLCNESVRNTLRDPMVRRHLYRKLLRLCTPGMGTGNPYYLCICAIIQPFLDDATDGSLEIVNLVKCLMPHAAYFTSTLTLDTRLQGEVLAAIVVSLVGTCVRVMTGAMMDSPVALAVKSPATVYSILFLLREVVRGCSVSSSERASLMLQYIRAVANPEVVNALGKASMVAFETFLPNESNLWDRSLGGCCLPYVVDPQLLCAEIDMVLHGRHIGEAIDIILRHNWNIGSVCALCGGTRGESPVCPANGAAHYVGHASLGRMLATITECAGSEVVKTKLKSLLCDSSRRLDSAVHFLVFHIFAHAGSHRKELYLEIEPYIRSSLVEVLNMSRSPISGVLDSEQKASLLALHAKLVVLLGNAVDPYHVDALLRTLSSIQICSNHDALVLWYLGNFLLRRGGNSVDLLPTSPEENNYCADHPDCAPTCKEAADNAQSLLKIIHRAHHFSPQMRKLVGCCVCKLIQDFNMQADNITTTLLSPFGLVPVSVQSLAEYGLPVGASSTFWSFFLRQMKTSAPARTGLMTSFVRSVTRRFSVPSPASCMPVAGEESTAELFAVMTYETVKQSPPLARVMLHLLTSWVKQIRSTPGRFVSLMYTSLQLIMVVVRRCVGADVSEVAAETRQDTVQFGEAVSKAAQVVRSQVRRMTEMAEETRDRNAVFFRLLERLLKRTRFVMKEVTGGDCDDVVGVLGVRGSLGSDAEEEGVAEVSEASPSDDAPCPGSELFSYTLEELQRPSDNDVFDDLMVSHDDYSTVSAPIPLQAQRRADQLRGTSSAHHSHGDSAIFIGQRDTVTPSAHNLLSAPCEESRTIASSDVSSTVVACSNNRSQGDGGASAEGHGRSNGPRFEVGGGHTALSRRAPTVSQGIQTSPTNLQAEVASVVERPSGEPVGQNVSAYPEVVRTESILDQRKRFSELLQDASVAVGNIGADSTWREMSMASDGDEVPIEDTTMPSLQGTSSACSATVPSALALQFFATYQNAREVLDELCQHEERQDCEGYAGFLAVRDQLNAAGGELEETAADGLNRGGAVCRSITSVSKSSPSAAILPVMMEGRPNNYDLPHSDRQQVPGRLVMTCVKMVNTVDRKRAREREKAEQGTRRGAAQMGVCVGRTETGGSRHLVTCSPRPEQGFTVNGPHGLQQPRVKANTGVTLISQQDTADALRDLEALLRPDGQSNTLSGGGNCASNVSNGAAMLSEGVIPQFLVEQGSGTAVQELRQAMGVRDLNMGSSLTRSGQKVRGGGANFVADGMAGTSWRVDVTAPPVPEYARDPQYSLEII